MAKLDEYKEKISFSTKLFFILGGLVVIIIGGLVNLHFSGKITAIFWLGIVLVFLLSYLNFIVFVHIKKYIKEIGEL